MWCSPGIFLFPARHIPLQLLTAQNSPFGTKPNWAGAYIFKSILTA